MGVYNLKVSYLGYETFSQGDLKADTKVDIELQPSSIQKQEVVVRGERKDQNTKSAAMSTVEIPIKEIKTLPALAGEVDILKTIQLLLVFRVGVREIQDFMLEVEDRTRT